MEIFELEGHEYIELHHLLKIMGWCESGGHAKSEIAGGAVSVDGVQELRKRCKVRAGQRVDYAGQQIQVR
ncbi:RNA-binding S4 domain-containing protein [Desulfurispirillum indicum]|uniref:Putative RNA-binding protein n=1 Tax=Desulfurispirillum indicum (strain ATCC BAA-1389 / DSM 22839 / S5) TaxID=653733 RepID=E6W2U3_DESIS|nr:RNA-binding S4 domain-containing protein [Desulfurispirillum indicum]ADU66768.1 putative RNA-binding protein [Desulfurispirillum indicum S5]UCZ56089.1 RNA-binding S4 domain-containing protein [Desulfurispirillum indicum]